MNAACFAPPGIVLGLFAPGMLGETCRVLQLSEAGGSEDISAAAYGLVFLVNCILEAPAYAIAGRIMGRPAHAILGQIAGLNLATHPAVYFVLPVLAERLGWTLLTQAAVSEVFAFTVEAALLRAVWKYPWRAAAAASFLANLTSWWSGAYLSGSGFLP
ncbi:MAG: hypothetical protein ACLPPF_08125 [Rhodomicrobium sp.]